MVYFVPETLAFIPAAWKDDGTYTADSWPAGAVLLSDDEREAFWKQSPPPGQVLGVHKGRPAWVRHEETLSDAQLAERERVWRDREVSSTEWLVTRHRDEQDMQLATTLTTEQFADLLAYRQALRDWPQSEGFPDADYRPGAPASLADVEGMQ